MTDDHTLVVENEDQGVEDTQGEKAYLFNVFYILRHPESCEKDNCPIVEHIDAVGIEDTFGLYYHEKGKRKFRHLEEGPYNLEYWTTHYQGPEGDDWDSGVNVTKVEKDD